jgi:IBR domain, a half RING-finger domain
MVNNLGFRIKADCVRLSRQNAARDTSATVKVEDPAFAARLSARLDDQRSSLKAVPINVVATARHTGCKKIHISWHKASRSAWLNFGTEDIAKKVALGFNTGRYKVLGRSVKSSSATTSTSGRRGYNRVAWTITLSDVPFSAAGNDVDKDIQQNLMPRHIEMGEICASDTEVCDRVRDLLEERGPLERFSVDSKAQGKRIKATAWFRDEADARAASLLNNHQRPMQPILGGDKLTVALVHSAKFKVSTAIYDALKAKIDEESVVWKSHYLSAKIFRNTDAYQRFTVLKIEGEDETALSKARAILAKILDGSTLTDDNKPVWDPALNNNGSTFRKLKTIDSELGVFILRNKSKRQLRYFGPDKHYQQVLQQVIDILAEHSHTTYDINLKPHEFSWALNGGFAKIKQTIGSEAAGIDIVSNPKRIRVTGSKQQYDAAVAIMHGKQAVHIRPAGSSASAGPNRTDCPICFCEPEKAIQTSCKHAYCLECFEDLCQSGGTSNTGEFQIRCHGSEGTCNAVFQLGELKERLSSSLLESVLESSFKEYIQRRPTELKYCPTPDCGYIYRCAALSEPAPHTCPNCLGSLCPFCHAEHRGHTCVEYKDIASGGYEALERFKKEQNIKACPKCSTLMAKSEGCNHMTCWACKAHICWVCMAVFNESGPVYDHMNKKHGGIGLGLERFMHD